MTVSEYDFYLSQNNDKSEPVKDELPGPFFFVICGGAGDLAQRKLLPTLYHLYQQNELPDIFSIIGFGMPIIDDNEYRELFINAVKKFSQDTYNRDTCAEFCKHLYFESGGFEEQSSYEKLKQKIGSCPDSTGEKKCNVIYYMAVPPDFFHVITENLGSCGLNRTGQETRIIIEKPFGNNRQSAIELNTTLNSVFSENQIFRMDHYLGKETVQNILFFRFSNSIFEPLWNRRYIDNIQITVAEDIGIEHRGAFYEKAGVIRDIVQNHIMQLISLVAMEPPVGLGPDFIRNEKVKIYNSLRPILNNDITANTVTGQYGSGRIGQEDVIGYNSEKNVSPDSGTPTFFAAKINIDTWRWAGVPFYIRAGKRLQRRLTEIVIQFKQPPLKLFEKSTDTLDPSYLVLRIQPKETISLRYRVKQPGTGGSVLPVDMTFCYNDAFSEAVNPAYSRLILDCMRGDFTLFVRQDGVEAMWKFIDPITDYWESKQTNPFPNYSAGSWGPHESDLLLKKDGRLWISSTGDLCG